MFKRIYNSSDVLVQTTSSLTAFRLTAACCNSLVTALPKIIVAFGSFNWNFERFTAVQVIRMFLDLLVLSVDILMAGDHVEADVEQTDIDNFDLAIAQ
jgi:hypothetical protein